MKEALSICDLGISAHFRDVSTVEENYRLEWTIIDYIFSITNLIGNVNGVQRQQKQQKYLQTITLTFNLIVTVGF